MAILVIDPDSDTLDSLLQLFATFDLGPAYPALSLRAGLEAFAVGGIRAVVVSVQRRPQEAVAFVQHVLGRARMPIILLVGPGDARHAALDAVRTDVRAVLVKPFDPRELVALLKGDARRGGGVLGRTDGDA